MKWRMCMAVVALVGTLGARGAERGQTWKVDGVERQGLVYAPEGAKTTASPVVFAFHGHGGTARQMGARMKFQELWPEAIVIYPQGLKTPGRLTDPTGLKAGWQTKVGDQGDRDVKFFDAMLTWVKQTYRVDEKRIYCTGHSNGGGFTYLLWGARGDVFAAVAPSSAATASVKDFKPKAALHIGGLKDPLVKFEWQKATIDAVMKLNGCDAQGTAEGEKIMVYPSAGGTPLETFLYDGGHTPPAEAWPVVVKFFKEHPGK